MTPSEEPEPSVRAKMANVLAGPPDGDLAFEVCFVEAGTERYVILPVVRLSDADACVALRAALDRVGGFLSGDVSWEEATVGR